MRKHCENFEVSDVITLRSGISNEAMHQAALAAVAPGARNTRAIESRERVAFNEQTHLWDSQGIGSG